MGGGIGIPHPNQSPTVQSGMSTSLYRFHIRGFKSQGFLRTLHRIPGPFGSPLLQGSWLRAVRRVLPLRSSRHELPRGSARGFNYKLQQVAKPAQRGGAAAGAQPPSPEVMALRHRTVWGSARPCSVPRAFSSWAEMKTNAFAARRVNTMFVLLHGFQQDTVNINSQGGPNAEFISQHVPSAPSLS